ncbi:hypothetical protein TWF730_006633 [Orbilia blumenaviensis]|uniref:Uncharacterized protein n=1 Tax=Orbilia blumenaviensis TaxID=1796055 RepID=A0AAV9VHF7_9PEZI
MLLSGEEHNMRFVKTSKTYSEGRLRKRREDNENTLERRAMCDACMKMKTWTSSEVSSELDAMEPLEMEQNRSASTSV